MVFVYKLFDNWFISWCVNLINFFYINKLFESFFLILKVKLFL